MEEKSIIDNLLDEIKNGFPLRKSQVGQAPTAEDEEKKTETKETTNEDENKEKLNETKKAKRNWKKTKMLASLIGKFWN